MKRDPAELYTEELAKRVKAYMAEGAEFDPLSADNICEATGDFDTCDEIHKHIEALYRANRADAVGPYMMAVSHKYWLPRATRQAEIDMATEATEQEEVAIATTAQVLAAVARAVAA